MFEQTMTYSNVLIMFLKQYVILKNISSVEEDTRHFQLVVKKRTVWKKRLINVVEEKSVPFNCFYNKKNLESKLIK